jgi:hypothetical protein
VHRGIALQSDLTRHWTGKRTTYWSSSSDGLRVRGAQICSGLRCSQKVRWTRSFPDYSEQPDLRTASCGWNERGELVLCLRGREGGSKPGASLVRENPFLSMVPGFVVAIFGDGRQYAVRSR